MVHFNSFARNESEWKLEISLNIMQRLIICMSACTGVRLKLLRNIVMCINLSKPISKLIFIIIDNHLIII